MWIYVCLLWILNFWNVVEHIRTSISVKNTVCQVSIFIIYVLSIFCILFYKYLYWVVFHSDIFILNRKHSETTDFFWFFLFCVYCYFYRTFDLFFFFFWKVYLFLSIHCNLGFYLTEKNISFVLSKFLLKKKKKI